MNIKGFLSLPHRFRWGGIGGDDCMTFPSSWMLYAIGIDPASNLRGTYSTKAEAHALMAADGGAHAFMGKRLMQVGCARIDDPRDGDIGLVCMLAGESPSDVRISEIGAVRFGPVWASISPRGVVAQRADCVAAWRFPR